MESFNLKNHKKISPGFSCILKEAGSPVSGFNISDVEEMARFLGYYPDRQSGTHKTWVNRDNGKTITYKNVNGQNPGHSFYAALKENGFTKEQIQYYVDNRKKLQREKRAFLRENKGVPYVPNLSPSQTVLESEPVAEIENKKSLVDWSNSAYKEMWDQIKSEVSEWVDDDNFDQEVLEWLSNHYGVPKEELEKRIVLASKKKWYEKSILFFEKQAQAVEIIEFEDWIERYEPITMRPGGEFDGYMLETYGDDLEVVEGFVKDLNNIVWTILDNQVIVNGFHTVNRFGYIITRKPWAEGSNIEVHDRELEDLDRSWEEENNLVDEELMNPNMLPSQNQTKKPVLEEPVVEMTEKERHKKVFEDAIKMYRKRKGK